MPDSSTKSSFVVVANRLPVDRVVQADGSSTWRTSPGGLVTALEPVMRANEGAWIGWHGAADEHLDTFVEDGLTLVPVPLSQTEVAEYYEGFSNATLWPLYHDVIVPPEYHREWWDAYEAVNRRFAEKAAAVADQGATVWVQDYQLQLVPQMLRALRPDLRIGFFLHIPFPPTEIFSQMPSRDAILEGLLGADLVGFQTPSAAANFLRLVKGRLGRSVTRDAVELEDGRVSIARAYPISIDTKGLSEQARTDAIQTRAAEIRRDLGDPDCLFLGVDRLDYTKGLRQRIRAFGELVAEGRLDPRRAVFLQVATPSRERVDQYRRLRDDIDRLVGRINGDVGVIGHPPITYLHASFPRHEMAAMYTAADVMVVSPLRDGMNLVAKEYVACRNNEDGALILSEFAGAARELRQAYMINPYDINGMKARMTEAYEDSPDERGKRMRALRRTVFRNDIDHWATTFLDDLRR